jgi:hypothetical protein
MLNDYLSKRRLVTLVIVIVVAILVIGILWWCFGSSSRSSNLAAPTNLAVSVSNATINLTWTGVSGATGYRVYVSTHSGVNFNQKGATYDVSQNSASLNLAPGSYYFRVTSLKFCNNRLIQSATLSNEVATQTPSCPSSNLSTPSSVIVESEGAGTAEVSWRSVLDAASYNVYRAQGSLVTTTTYDQVYNTQATEVLFTGLQAGTSHSFLVTAQDGCGNQTSPSPAVYFNVGCAPPSSVEITQVSATTSSISLNWAALAGVNTYTLYLKAGTWVNSSSYDQTATVQSNVLTYTFSGLNVGSPYAVAVAAGTTACGEGQMTVVGVDTQRTSLSEDEDVDKPAVAPPTKVADPPAVDNNNAGQKVAKQYSVATPTYRSGMAARGILSRQAS